MIQADMTNALTFDVEDYYHVSAFEKHISRDDWPQWESRVVANTERILSLLEKHEVKATFFILGMVAEQYPGLVADIHGAGHEVACHGYSHKLIYSQTPEQFEYETQKSKDLLQSAINKPVLGYRAASYSITRQSLWALDILENAGFKYDSSIFPIHHDRYGISDFSRQIEPINYQQRAYELVEFPITSVKMLSQNIPAAGGGYFRLYPLYLTKFLLKRFLRDENQPFMFYLHPWEFDPQQPRVQGLSPFTKFRHYNNIHKCEQRLDSLLKTFKFSRVDSILSGLGYLESV